VKIPLPQGIGYGLRFQCQEDVARCYASWHKIPGYHVSIVISKNGNAIKKSGEVLCVIRDRGHSFRACITFLEPVHEGFLWCHG
jgi:hypothetical protein